MLDTATPTAVYRFYDADDRLLYVGMTETPKARWTWHRKRSSWWPDARRREIAWYDSRAEAAAIETQAIRTEAPLHNVTYNGPPAAPTNGNTPTRPLRVPMDLWDAYGEACAAMGRNRSEDLRAHMLRQVAAHRRRAAAAAHDDSA